METRAFEALRAGLAAGLDLPTLAALEAAVARQCVPLPAIDLEVLRLEAESVIAQVFIELAKEDPYALRTGVEMFKAWRAGAPLTSFNDNAAQSNAWFKAAAALAAQPPHARPAVPPPWGVGPALVHASGYWSIALGAIDARDKLELDRASLPLLTALERHRAAAGAYPESLDALVPAYIPSVPLDPWTAKPLLYKKLATPDPQGRTFRLYSVGHDRTDNNGTPQPARFFTPGYAVPGTDIVLNAPPPRPPKP